MSQQAITKIYVSPSLWPVPENIRERFTELCFVDNPHRVGCYIVSSKDLDQCKGLAIDPKASRYLVLYDTAPDVDLEWWGVHYHAMVTPDVPFTEWNELLGGIVLPDINSKKIKISMYDINSELAKLDSESETGISFHKTDGKTASFLDRLDKAKLAMKWRRFKRICLQYFILTLLLTAGLAYGWQQLPDPYAYTITTRGVTDDRGCTILFEDGTEIDGVRSYQYQYKQLFGYRWIDTTSIKEETTLTVSATKFIVAGHGGSDNTTDVQKIYAGDTKMTLKNHPQYTFTLGEMVMVLGYNSFCQ